ncbi:hypothetical protein BCR39DRAFT_82491 [Naematelia encephala]|uniref:Cupin type-2 domain-containing protein n=1 Tax=Naematelia encephala TaxID=71784 RepID=A0A1Y2BAG8_9TREE|nr:hypothetical protein BCR39DRAFT_82491 [Naematelia encephala]
MSFAPRRIVLTNSTKDASPVVADSVIELAPSQGGLSLGLAYVQDGYVGNPDTAIEGTTRAPDSGSIHSMGPSSAYMEFPPGAQFPVHYTGSLDYIVVLDGELELGLADGTSKTLKSGDLLICVAGLHGWSNKTDKPARVLAISSPGETTKIDGKELNEAPFNHYKLF